MRQDLLTESELAGDIDSFTDAQRKARATFIAHGLHLPREWVREDWEDGVGVDASPAGRVATGIYNAVVESGAFDPRLTCCWKVATGTKRSCCVAAGRGCPVCGSP